MRWILALVAAGGLSLGMAQTAHAQVIVGSNPWGGVGVTVGNPWMYSSGFSGVVGPRFMPGTTVVSPGFAPMAPVPMVYNRTFVTGPVWGAPGWGVNRFGRVRRFGPYRGFWW
jgi:hypothetical protein